MKDYREMSPCERVTYYRERIRSLSVPLSSRHNLLRQTFLAILRENEALCSDAAGTAEPLPEPPRGPRGAV
jgi:hypothetical protein